MKHLIGRFYIVRKIGFIPVVGCMLYSRKAVVIANVLLAIAIVSIIVGVVCL